MGIQITVDQEDDEENGLTRQSQMRNDTEDVQYNAVAQAKISGLPSRRASFTSMYDVSEHLSRQNRRGTSKKPWRSQSQASSRVKLERSTASADPAPTPTHTSGERRRRPMYQPSTRGRLNHFVSEPEAHIRRDASIASLASSKDRVRIISQHGHRRVSSALSHASIGLHNYRDTNVLRSSSPQESEAEKHPYSPPDLLYSPSTIQLELDAEMFQRTFFLSRIRRVLHNWHDQTLRLQSTYASMYAIAEAHDYTTLLKQAFEQWRSIARERQQEAETFRFFRHLERRATKARDLYLLTKAFTHWAQSASDECQKTSVARRHVLRTKCFNAWKDITAVNELKVRRQGLMKFFGIWRRRNAEISVYRERAVDSYLSNLIRRCLQSWMSTHFEIQANWWRVRSLKKRFFQRWVSIMTETRQKCAWLETLREHSIRTKYLRIWMARLQETRNAAYEALSFRRRHLLANLLNVFRKEAQLHPHIRQVKQIINFRVAQTALSIWHSRTQLAKQATSLDHSRLIRNSWTVWNDRLRTQALSNAIDDRLLLQALCRWCLAARQKLFGRVREKNTRARLFVLWKGRSRNVAERLAAAETVFRTASRTRIIAATLSKWRSRINEQIRLEQIAYNFDASRLQSSALVLWKVKYQRLSQMTQWATDARFYMLTTFYLKRWRASVDKSRRERRREAYAIVRRNAKMRCAKDALERWRTATQQLKGLAQKAAYVYEDRCVSAARSALVVWRGKSDHFIALTSRAILRNNTTILQRALVQWSVHLRHIQLLSQRAAAFDTETFEAVASVLLRKLNWRCWQIRQLSETAQSLRERNERKHIRNMIRYWAERTNVQRDAPPPDSYSTLVDGELPEPLIGDEDEDDQGTVRAEGWTSFDLLQTSPTRDRDLIHATPLPGYLRTPSRRTARAKARAATLVALGSTTPVTAPMMGKVSSFDARLKRELGRSVGLETGARRGGREDGRVFEDIPETSPALGAL